MNAYEWQRDEYLWMAKWWAYEKFYGEVMNAYEWQVTSLWQKNDERMTIFYGKVMIFLTARWRAYDKFLTAKWWANDKFLTAKWWAYDNFYGKVMNVYVSDNVNKTRWKWLDSSFPPSSLSEVLKGILTLSAT